MRTTITTIFAVASVCATSVHGQVDNCVELLRLSRTTSRTVEDQEQFRSTVNNFCNEVRSARSENRSLNLDLRVMGLGEGGGSEASTNSLYTKYCSGENEENYDRRNYQQYLEGIAPGAYAAYQACTTAARNDVQFQMLTSPTRDVLELVVFHETNTPGQADMSWSASDPVTCNWESFRGDGEVEAPQRRILRANERTRLKCRRDSFDAEPIREPDFVNVIRDGGNATINIPWRKYGPDNIPVQTLEEMQRDLERNIESVRAELEQRTEDLEQRADTIFGDWTKVDVNRIHRAESDGILVVESRGTRAAAFVVSVGESDNERELESRTRGRAFQAGSTPVKKGHYYFVRVSGRPQTIHAYWLSAGR